MKDIPYSKEQLMRANMKLMEQNKRYREALEFYADKENWKKLIIDNNTMYLGKMNVEQDYGDKARKALESDEN